MLKKKNKNIFDSLLNQAKKRKKRNKKKIIIITASIFGFIFAVTLILFFVYKGPAQEAYQSGIVGKEAFLKAQDALLDQDFSAAHDELTVALDAFDNASRSFDSFRWLSWVPWVGTQINAVDNILAAGIDTASAIQSITELAIGIIVPIQQDDALSLSSLSEEDMTHLLQSIYEAKPVLESSKESIDSAVSHLDAITSERLVRQLREVVDPLKKDIPPIQKGITQAISASRIIPWIAGYPEDKTYLFLMQNNTEMRPTGGFIGTYGELMVSNGTIETFHTDNSYNLDKPAEDYLYVDPPWPLTRYNNVHRWFFRDSNWSPDFPKAAEKVEWFYHEEGGSIDDLDGIIAVTPTFIESLLPLTGDMQINGLEFTPETFTDTLQYQVEQGYAYQGIEFSDRKDIIGDLSSQMLERLMALPRSEWPELWDVINHNIAEKHLLLYVKDEIIQNLIVKENWGGAIKKDTHDYIAFFDANLASLKSDPVVKRSIDYTFQENRGKHIASLSIHYDHQGEITWKTTRYRTYVRVLIPEQSAILSVDGPMVDCKLDDEGTVEIENQFGKKVVGTFLCIEPGEQKTLTVKYTLPESASQLIKKGVYTLDVQKQPGTESYPITLSIDLDDDFTIEEIPDTITPSEDNDLIFSGELSQDFQLRIIE